MPLNRKELRSMMAVTGLGALCHRGGRGAGGRKIGYGDQAWRGVDDTTKGIREKRGHARLSS